MEAVGAAASILTFATVATSSAKFCYETLSSFADGPSNIKRAAAAILELLSLLEDIRQSPDDTLIPNVEQCTSELIRFSTKIVKLQQIPQESAGVRLWKRVQGILKEKELDQMSDAILRHCAQLTLRLNLGTSKAVSALADTVAQSSNATRTLETKCLEQFTRQSAQAIDVQHAADKRSDSQTALIQSSYAALQATQNDIAAHMATTTLINDMTKGLVARLDTQENNIEDLISSVQASLQNLQLSSISNANVATMQDTLHQILQRVQVEPTNHASGQSRVIGEVDTESDAFHPIISEQESQDKIIHEEISQRLIDSITRLGKLVTEKEQTFDSFAYDNQKFEDIIQDLSTVLEEARVCLTASAERFCAQHKLEAAEMNQNLKRFEKQFAFSQLELNPQHISSRTRSKRQFDVVDQHHTYQEASIGVGVLTIKRRRIVQACSCNEKSCLLCGSQNDLAQHDSEARVTKTEDTTVVTFMPSDYQKFRMLIATDYIARLSHGGTITSISHLAVSCLKRNDSKVFQVVADGKLDELRKMLETGQATLRDYDENGWSLLFVSVRD
jgi:hypothetical protein